MVDAAAMSKGLREAGRIALYGIYFDTDPGGGEAGEPPCPRARSRNCWPAMRSSMSSSSATPTARAPYAYNLDLSRRRAEAIAEELVKNYRIVPAAPAHRRCRAFLAPVGSNASEAGRALNRRVELVAP